MKDNGKKNIFRHESLGRVASPEQLSDYLHVTNPRTWIILSIILLMMTGLFAWASLDNLDSILEANASVTEGVAVMALSDTDTFVEAGMTVRMGGNEYKISSVQEDKNGFLMVYVPVSLPDGIYDAVIVIESLRPIEFLFKM